MKKYSLKVIIFLSVVLVAALGTSTVWTESLAQSETEGTGSLNIVVLPSSPESQPQFEPSVQVTEPFPQTTKDSQAAEPVSALTPTGTVYITDNETTTEGSFSSTSGLTSSFFEIDTESGSGHTTIEDLPSGNYSASVTPPQGTSVTTTTCSNGGELSNIQVLAGQTVTCAVYLEKEPSGPTYANITIKKTVAGDPSNTTKFTVEVSCTTTDGKQVPVPPKIFEVSHGSYQFTKIEAPEGKILSHCTVIETKKEGFNKVEPACSKKEERGGITMVCDITNQRTTTQKKETIGLTNVGPELITPLPIQDLLPKDQQGKLKIVIKTQGGDIQVNLKSNFLSDFLLTTVNGQATEEFDLNPRNYQLSAQIVQSGWKVESVQVSGESSLLLDEIEVKEGKTTEVLLVAAKFEEQESQRQVVNIIITKTTEPANAELAEGKKFQVEITCFTTDGMKIGPKTADLNYPEPNKTVVTIPAPPGKKISDCSVKEKPLSGWIASKPKCSALDNNRINCTMKNRLKALKPVEPPPQKPGEPKPTKGYDRAEITVKKTVVGYADDPNKPVTFEVKITCITGKKKEIERTIEISHNEKGAVTIDAPKNDAIVDCTVTEKLPKLPRKAWQEPEIKCSDTKTYAILLKDCTITNKPTVYRLTEAKVTVQKIIAQAYPDSLKQKFDITVSCYDQAEKPIGDQKKVTLGHNEKSEEMTFSSKDGKFIKRCVCVEKLPPGWKLLGIEYPKQIINGDKGSMECIVKNGQESRR